ncbi:MAG TPA: MtaA/CmuA family methyltransferase [Methanomassiliicoccales archaeon]|nr:MtaA/CmuA family methyltransferase [Methanomassiliicoccales archaeon]
MVLLNERQRLLAILSLEKVDRAPCVCPMQTATISLMKASGSFWPDAHHDPEKMAILALAANRYAGLESVRVPFETSVDASAFGVPTKDRRLLRQPQVLERRLLGREGFEEVDVPDPRKDGMVPVVLDAIHRIKIGAPHLPIICGIAAPHTLAFELLGQQEADRLIDLDPVLMKATLHKARKWAIDYATAAVEAGADVITLIDPYASGDFLTTEQYREFALPFHRRTCQELERLGIPVILHICGNATSNLALMAETGACGISIDHEVDVRQAKKLLAGKSAVIGNLNPAGAMLRGAPFEVESETRACLEAGVDATSPGCGLALETPLENLRSFVESTRRFGAKVPEG